MQHVSAEVDLCVQCDSTCFVSLTDCDYEDGTIIIINKHLYYTSLGMKSTLLLHQIKLTFKLFLIHYNALIMTP